MTKEDIFSNGIPFLKMHGLGNDFVIIDARDGESPINSRIAQAIGERHFGVGYDQLVVMTESDHADVNLEFWNSDGSLSDACGNASRCVARFIMDQNNSQEITMKTGSRSLLAQKTQNGLITVNMGHPQLEWNMIPLKENVDLIELPIKGKFFTYVTKTCANLTTNSRKLENYNGTIIFEIDIMKKFSPINLNLCQT